METPQPPQISVSGRIVIEGQLPAPSGNISEDAPASLSPPWWQFWRPATSHTRELANATNRLAFFTAILVLSTIIIGGIQARILSIQANIFKKTDLSTQKLAQWQQKSEIRQTLLTYLAAYKEISAAKNEYEALACVEAYKKAQPYQQVQVRLAADLLVMVVDEMYQSGDRRANQWAGFIAAIPGPLVTSDYELKAYATDPRTVDAIEKAKRIVTGQSPNPGPC